MYKSTRNISITNKRKKYGTHICHCGKKKTRINLKKTRDK